MLKLTTEIEDGRFLIHSVLAIFWFLQCVWSNLRIKKSIAYEMTIKTVLFANNRYFFLSFGMLIEMLYCLSIKNCFFLSS